VADGHDDALTAIGVGGSVGAEVDADAVAACDETPPDEDAELEAPQASTAPASNTIRSNLRVMCDMSAD
jgi:hypothetical protein